MRTYLSTLLENDNGLTKSLYMHACECFYKQQCIANHLQTSAEVFSGHITLKFAFYFILMEARAPICLGNRSLIDNMNQSHSFLAHKSYIRTVISANADSINH